jgi:hypothetical protein
VSFWGPAEMPRREGGGGNDELLRLGGEEWRRRQPNADGLLFIERQTGDTHECPCHTQRTVASHNCRTIKPPLSSTTVPPLTPKASYIPGERGQGGETLLDARRQIGEQDGGPDPEVASRQIHNLKLRHVVGVNDRLLALPHLLREEGIEGHRPLCRASRD